MFKVFCFGFAFVLVSRKYEEGIHNLRPFKQYKNLKL